MKSDPNPKERIVHQHITLSCPIDLLQATYYQQHFSRHTHDGYAFGIITSGQLDFSYRHKNWHALPGDINLVIPGEAHDGNAGGEAAFFGKPFYQGGYRRDVPHAESDSADDAVK